MTYEELVERIRQEVKELDASHIKEHVAVELDIRGPGEGALYIEIRDGKIIVEPYEYYDRDAIITTSAQMALDIASGAITIESAYNRGLIHFRGKLDKAYLFDEAKRTKE